MLIFFLVLLVSLCFTWFFLRRFIFSTANVSPCHSGVCKVDSQYDIIVVGGGICGAAFAYTMGKQGKKVILIEKDLSLQDRIVGEVLQPLGVQRMRELGLYDCFDGIEAQVLHGYGIHMGDFQPALAYPNSETGRGFHQGKLVQKLREKIKTELNNK